MWVVLLCIFPVLKISTRYDLVFSTRANFITSVLTQCFSSAASAYFCMSVVALISCVIIAFVTSNWIFGKTDGLLSHNKV